jgi:N-acyl-phosphatidylethanolamine-hydrolysing phospholipase D
MWRITLENAGHIQATWLRHAAFLEELPTPPGSTRGPRVLFEPALSVG